MNPTQESIYVEATYMSSKTEYFPNNKPDNFHLKLSKPLKLTGGSWKVGLCEINFTDITPVKKKKKKADDHVAKTIVKASTEAASTKAGNKNEST